MLTLFVVDKSAEARTRLVEKINHFLKSDISLASYLPQISLQPLASEELQFHAAPEICILGSECLENDLIEVGKIRKTIPETALIVWLSSDKQDFNTIEQLAAFGVDDTLDPDINANDFIKKLLLIAGRKKSPTKHGRLITVASGKGGVGVTSITAALAECLVASGYSTVAIDGDFETQDLSRFLQARPFINENLQILFDKSKAVTKESVEECLVQVWDEEDKFKCLTPCVENEAFYSQQNNYAKTLLSILEVLDSSFDFIIVDAGSLKGSLLRTLLRVTDDLIFVTNNDPAALYAGVNKLVQYRASLSAGALLTIVENSHNKYGLSSEFIQQEFYSAAQLLPTDFFTSVPYCKTGIKWVASGGTLYSRSSSRTIKAIRTVMERLIPEELKNDKPSLLPALQTLMRRLQTKSKNTVKSLEYKLASIPQIEAKEEPKALPAPVEEEIELNRSPLSAEKQRAKSLISGVQLVSERPVTFN